MFDWPCHALSSLKSPCPLGWRLLPGIGEVIPQDCMCTQSTLGLSSVFWEREIKGDPPFSPGFTLQRMMSRERGQMWLWEAMLPGRGHIPSRDIWWLSQSLGCFSKHENSSVSSFEPGWREMKWKRIWKVFTSLLPQRPWCWKYQLRKRNSLGNYYSYSSQPKGQWKGTPVVLTFVIKTQKIVLKEFS